MQRKRSGFTLIELVMVIAILAILAAVVVPRFRDLAARAKESACKAALGSLRSAIQIFHAEQLVDSNDVYPTLAEVKESAANARDSAILEDGDVPVNPYNNLDTVREDADGTRDALGTSGWAYYPDTGDIWADDDAAHINW